MKKVKSVKETTAYKVGRHWHDIPWVTKSGKTIYITEKQAAQYSAQRKQFQMANAIAREAVRKYGGTVKDYMYSTGVNTETGEMVKGAVALAKEITDEGYLAAWDNMWVSVSNFVVDTIAGMNSDRWRRIFANRWSRVNTKVSELGLRGKVAGGKLLTYAETNSGHVHDLIREIVFTSNDEHSEKVYQNNWSPLVDLLKSIGYDDIAKDIDELTKLLTEYDRNDNILL